MYKTWDRSQPENAYPVKVNLLFVDINMILKTVWWELLLKQYYSVGNFWGHRIGRDFILDLSFTSSGSLRRFLN